MLEPIKIVIDLPPVTKKNHGQLVRRGNRSYMLPSKPYQQYASDCHYYLYKYRRAEPINTPISLKCLFFVNHKRKCDLTNFLQAIQDILVDYNIIEDDNYNIVKATLKGYAGGTDLITYLPIPIKTYNSFNYISGAKEVIYNHQGNPSYYRDAYKLYGDSAEV